MSTKIYEAYRFPLANLHRFLLYTRHQVYSQYLDWIRKQLKSIGESINNVSDDMSKAKLKMEVWNELERRILRDSRNRSGYYNINSLWLMWFDLENEYVYVIPYMRFKHNAQELEFVEDFSFWDNTDPPQGVDEDEWWARGAAWEEVALNNWNSLALRHVILDGISVHSEAMGRAFAVAIYGEDFDSEEDAVDEA